MSLTLFFEATSANSIASNRLPAWFTLRIAALQDFESIALLRIFLFVTVRSSPVTKVFGNFFVSSDMSSNASSCTASSA